MRMEMFCLPRMSATSGCFVQNAWVYLGHDSLSSSKDSHLVRAQLQRNQCLCFHIMYNPRLKQPLPTDGCLWFSRDFSGHLQHKFKDILSKQALEFHCRKASDGVRHPSASSNFMSCLLGEAQSLPQRQPTWKNPSFQFSPSWKLDNSFFVTNIFEFLIVFSTCSQEASFVFTMWIFACDVL